MLTPCRLCGKELVHVVADLGATPLANSYLRPEQLTEVEPHYPLKAMICDGCLLVQLETVVDPRGVFTDYAYFSSYSDTLLTSSKNYAERISARLGLKPGDRIVEIASNDGYMLQHFLGRGMNVLGIDPAANIARVAMDRGVPTLVRFFGSDVARELKAGGERARLIIANNVVAHVAALNDFVEGLKILLAPGGVMTLEFHHLLCLIEQHQFDTIYHEHFSYFSLRTVRTALAKHGLEVVDVESLPSQGGSLRVYARHREELTGETAAAVQEVLAREEDAGLYDLARYGRFADCITKSKLSVLSFLTNAKLAGETIVCYGAAAKGNTLLNYCGVRADLVDYAVDRNPHKQGHFLPGSRIPIYSPDRILETKPDYLFILPWNLRGEIMDQMSGIRSWGGRFVIPIPEVQVLP